VYLITQFDANLGLGLGYHSPRGTSAPPGGEDRLRAPGPP